MSLKKAISFAFSDVQRIIAVAGFSRLCPKPSDSSVNSLVATLLRLVA